MFKNIMFKTNNIELTNNIKLIIIVSIILIFYSSVCFAGDLNLDKLDTAGNRILNIVRRVGYWIIVIKAVIDVIKSVTQGGTKDIGGIVMKYILMYLALWAIPWALRLVEGIF